MTREEFARLVKGMRAVYTYKDFIADKDSFDMWYSLLEDLPYKVAAASLKAHMQTNPKVPTPADIRKGAATMTKKEQLPDLMAWDMVRKAIGRSAYYSEEEFEKLPETIQRVIGTPRQLFEWSQTQDGVDTVVSSQFLRAYRAEQEREEGRRRLSADVLSLVQNTITQIEHNATAPKIEERVEGIPMPEDLKEKLGGLR